MKQDICWWCYQGRVEPKRLITEAARIGYAGFELVPEPLWDEVRAAGLRIVTHGGHGTIENGMNDPRHHSRIEDEIRANIDKAVKYDIPILICFSGNRRGRPDEEGIENTVQLLKRVAPYAEQKGVTLAIELLNSKVDHRDYQFDRMSWGVKVVELVNSPRVKILYDIYHAQIMEGDLIRTIRTYADKIAHFHTAGNPGRNEIDETQEINYRAVMRAIKETGYTGFIGQEFIPKGDPILALRRAFEICSV
jgi:hydroxypyruvate isomerase